MIQILLKKYTYFALLVEIKTIHKMHGTHIRIKIKYKIFILVRSVTYMNRPAVNTHRAHKK